MAPISKFASSPITWIFVLCIVVAAASSDKKIVCYFTNWSAYRPGIAKFTASNINPYLCTHLVYAFVGMDSEFRLRPFDKWQDIDQGAYAKFNGLKTYNKELKTLLAIGGWNEGSKRFSLLAEDSELRKNFTKSVVRYLRQYQFDGFDLDWEYPGSRDGGRPEDKENYLRLVKDLRRAFESEAKKTKRPRLLLTMAVPAGIETIEKGYDVPRLSKYLDFFNLLSYDYHASTEPLVNHHSPLRSYDETDFEHQLTVEYTVRHYLKNGAPRHKIVVGIPTYGRAYKLFNPDVNGLESPSLGPSEASKYTKEKGYMAYYEICEKIGVENWLIEKPYPEDVGPYAYSQEGDWVGYDDEDMVARKANYVLEEDLGGIMFWSLETDDFRGVCTGKQYPLLEAGKEAIIQGLKRQEGGKSSTGLKKSPKVPSNNAVRSNSVLRSLSSVSPRDQSIGKESSDFNGVTQAIFRATPPTPPTPAPDADFTCKDEGFYAHPTDCKRYFRCLDAGALGIIPNAFVCPSGLYYNKLSGSCDYSTNVICKAPVTSTFKPFLASGTSLATRSPTTTPEPFLDYVDFSSEEKDIFDDSEEVVKSKEITRSEEDSETELEKLLDLIHELGGVSRVRQLLAKSKVSSSDPEISKEQRESLKKFLDTTASASNSRRGPVGGSVPKEILEKTDFDPTFNQHDTIDAKPRQYQTIRRNRPIPSSTSEEPSTTPVVEQFKSQDSEELETDFREDELPVSPNDEFLDSYEYYEDDILSINATPKSVNLQRRPSVIADISSEEAEVEIEITTRTSTTAEPSTTVTTVEPTTTRRKLIRGPARRRFSSAITATTSETSVVERASVGPIRIRPPTSSKRRFVARPRSTTSQPIVEENDEVVETRDFNFRFPSPVDVEGRSFPLRHVDTKSYDFNGDLPQTERTKRIRRPTDLTLASSKNKPVEDANQPKILPSFKEALERKRNPYPLIETSTNFERFKRKDVETSSPFVESYDIDIKPKESKITRFRHIHSRPEIRLFEPFTYKSYIPKHKDTNSAVFFSNREFNDRMFIEVLSQNENYAKNSFHYPKNTYRTEDQVPFDLTTDDLKPENTKLIDYSHFDDEVTSVFNSHGGLSNWAKQPHIQAMVTRPRELIHPGLGDFGPSMVDENHAKDSFRSSKNNYRAKVQAPSDLMTNDFKTKNTQPNDYGSFDDGITNTFNVHGGQSNWDKQPHSQAVVTNPHELGNHDLDNPVFFGPSFIDEITAEDSFNPSKNNKVPFDLRIDDFKKENTELGDYSQFYDEVTNINKNRDQSNRATKQYSREVMAMPHSFENVQDSLQLPASINFSGDPLKINYTNRHDQLEPIKDYLSKEHLYRNRPELEKRHPQDKTWDPWWSIYTSGGLDDVQEEDIIRNVDKLDVQRIFKRNSKDFGFNNRTLISGQMNPVPIFWDHWFDVDTLGENKQVDEHPLSFFWQKMQKSIFSNSLWKRTVATRLNSN